MIKSSEDAQHSNQCHLKLTHDPLDSYEHLQSPRAAHLPSVYSKHCVTILIAYYLH